MDLLKVLFWELRLSTGWIPKILDRGMRMPIQCFPSRRLRFLRTSVYSGVVFRGGLWAAVRSWSMWRGLLFPFPFSFYIFFIFLMHVCIWISLWYFVGRKFGCNCYLRDINILPLWRKKFVTSWYFFDNGSFIAQKFKHYTRPLHNWDAHSHFSPQDTIKVNIRLSINSHG
jgi:hypothetical protein